MQDTNYASILLIGFNRPDFMRDQIAALRPVRPPKIYMAVDGPRPLRADDITNCAKVRDCKKDIDWSCEIHTLFRDKNLGCKTSVSSAITWFFENESEGIILEDDCRPTPDFLSFASKLLAHYRGSDKVGAICGFNPYNLQSDQAASYHFSGHFGVWGWATWRNVWQKYDVTLKRYDHILESILQTPHLLPIYKRELRKYINDVHSGEIAVWTTWDVQFMLTLRVNRLLCAYPRYRLVRNVGVCNGEATHTGGYDQHYSLFMQTGSIKKITHPKIIEVDYKTENANCYFSSGFLSRAITYLGCKIPRLQAPLTTLCSFLETHTPILFYW